MMYAVQRKTLAIAPYGEGAVDLYLPKGISAPPCIVYFHGGGLEGGDRASDQGLYMDIAENGVAVAAADYRVYPDARYPQFVEDAAAAAAFMRHSASALGLGPVWVGGSSAGAYLSMMLCFAEEFLGKHGLCTDDFAGWFFDAGQPTTHYNILRERGEDTRLIRVDEAAPLYHITRDFSGSPPPIQILVADGDMPSRPEQNLLLRAALIHFGYPAEKIGFRVMRGYGHCGYGGEKRDGRWILGKMVTDFVLSGPFDIPDAVVYNCTDTANSDVRHKKSP